MHNYFLLLLFSTFVLYSPHSITMMPSDDLDKLFGIPVGMSKDEQLDYFYGKEMAKKIRKAQSRSTEEFLASQDWQNKKLLGAISCDYVDGLCDALKLGADINAEVDSGQFTPLIYAIRKNSIACAEKLIDLGADCLFNKHKYTALHATWERGHATIVQRLIEKKADPTAQTKLWRDNYLHLAAGNGHDTVVKLLLTNPNAYILKNTRNSVYRTPIDCAYEFGKHHIVTLLGGIDHVSPCFKLTK